MTEQLTFDWQTHPWWVCTRYPGSTTGPFDTEADARGWKGPTPAVERHITQDPALLCGNLLLGAPRPVAGEHPACDRCEGGLASSDVTRPTRTADGEWGTVTIGVEDRTCWSCHGTTIAGFGRWIADMGVHGYAVTVAPGGRFTGPDHATYAIEHPEVNALWDLPSGSWDLPDGHLPWLKVHKEGGKETYEPPRAPTQNQMRGHVSAA